jgi:hypothetical protein
MTLLFAGGLSEYNLGFRTVKFNEVVFNSSTTAVKDSV